MKDFEREELADKCSILVVDDHNILRKQLAKYLRRRGWEVFEAACYEEAVEQIEAHPPNRAVVDLKMPGKSGLDLIRDMKPKYPSIEWLILTGYGSITTAVEAIKAGATNYLPKPADVEDILHAFDQSYAAEETHAAPSLARAEWEHIQRVLADCGGNITHAAKKLRIHRRTLQRKLDQHAPK